jgi:putative Holliday junction resolvase
MRILGLDLGDRRIGLALSDPSFTFASPLGVMEGEAALWKELPGLIAEKEVSRIVLGLPVNMDGTLGPRARRALDFKARLETAFHLPVEAWDERLTTFQAQGALREGGLSSRQQAAHVDKVAAQIILQSYLDRQRVRERDEAEASEAPDDEE